MRIFDRASFGVAGILCAVGSGIFCLPSAIGAIAACNALQGKKSDMHEISGLLVRKLNIQPGSNLDKTVRVVTPFVFTAGTGFVTCGLARASYVMGRACIFGKGF